MGKVDPNVMFSGECEVQQVFQTDLDGGGVLTTRISGPGGKFSASRVIVGASAVAGVITAMTGLGAMMYPDATIRLVMRFLGGG